MTKLDERKQAILEKMKSLDRPIWAGDVAMRVADQEQFRTAFRALVEEGKIVRRPGAKGDRAYYWFRKRSDRQPGEPIARPAVVAVEGHNKGNANGQEQA